MFQLALLVVLPVLVAGQGKLDPYDVTATEFYEAIDLNRDGFIPNSEVHIFFQRYDTNANGEITREEFTSHLDQDNSKFKGHEATLFDWFDINEDNHLTEFDFNHVFNINDFDNNGFVSKLEFVLYWTKVFEILDDSYIVGR